ncbi:MAG: hypothetical protein H7839_03760 [Magnetococcus sp. YQC-5]
MHNRRSDLDVFYGLLSQLENRMGGRRCLGECHGKLNWPERGIYFFFEAGENRNSTQSVSRVVRVGTHALKTNSRTTLWQRLRQHRGTLNPRGGNHRGSIFRLLSGEALLMREGAILSTWGQGQSASSDVISAERTHEVCVSDYLGRMTFILLPVPDAPNPNSNRGIIERNSIALLGSCHDIPSTTWLGHHSGRQKVRSSGLWNINHVCEIYDQEFLVLLERLVETTPRF